MPDPDSLMDFDRARRKAFFKKVLGVITGQPSDLLSFEEVRRILRLANNYYRGLQYIPLDKIVGSVGRYRDFTKEFLPLTDEMRERWARVEEQVKTGGLPPVELYKVGDVYFVRDGNHRVSIARANNSPDIEAYVWEFPTRVPLTPDMDVNDIILQEGRVTFFAQTRLDELRPDNHIEFTEPGRYRELLEHIDVHRYFMGEKAKHEIAYLDAVSSWYDTVYLPALKLIREQKILEKFPGRTEADLYIWLSRYLYQLGERYDEDRDNGADASAAKGEGKSDRRQK
jgi:hypothetical protein